MINGTMSGWIGYAGGHECSHACGSCSGVSEDTFGTSRSLQKGYIYFRRVVFGAFLAKFLSLLL